MRNRRNRKGQAFVELGIIVAVLITITIGAIDFGYTFLALHMTTQATAAGARAASVLGANYRNACGGFVYTTPNRIDAITQLVTSRSEEHTSELQSRLHLVCRLLLEKKERTSVFPE